MISAPIHIIQAKIGINNSLQGVFPVVTVLEWNSFHTG